MSTVSRIFANFGLLTVGKLAGDVFTFVFFVVLARTYGPDGIGQYSIAIALTGFSMAIADFGLHQLTIRELALRAHEFGEYFGRIFVLRLLLSAGSVALLALVLAVAPFEGQTIMVIVLVGSHQLVHALVSGLAAVFMANERMYEASLLEVSFKASLAIVGIVATVAGATLVQMLGAMVGPAVALLYVAYRAVTKSYGGLIWRSTRAAVGAQFVHALPFGATALLQQICMRADVVLLGFMMGEAAAGMFNVAYRVVFLLLFVPYYLSLSVLPAASRLFATAPQEMAALYRKAIRMALLVGLPASAGLSLVSADLIVLLYGEDMAQASGVLRSLAWLLLLEFLVSALGAFLVAARRQGPWMWSWAGAGAVGVGANLVLIPLIGIDGAVFSTLLCYVCLAAALALQVRRQLGPACVARAAGVASLGTAAFVVPFSVFPAPMYLVVPASAVIYATVLYCLRGSVRDELAALWLALRHKGK